MMAIFTSALIGSTIFEIIFGTALDTFHKLTRLRRLDYSLGDRQSIRSSMKNGCNPTIAKEKR
jgi:hypothetical protein